MYKVLITTSGTGSRLGKLTATTNKSLITIGNKRVIDRIISSYDSNIPLVITLGYYGDKVQDYVNSTYPDRHITFVLVGPYEGPGSSLGYSLLSAKNDLQCPFIFHCNDTIVDDPIPTPEKENWDGISLGSNPDIFNTTHYSSVIINNNQITNLQPKGAKSFDGFHIGIVGIKDYKAFWTYLEKEYEKNPNDTTLNDCSAITLMLKEGIPFRGVHFKNWIDTGNPVSFEEANRLLSA